MVRARQLPFRIPHARGGADRASRRGLLASFALLLSAFFHPTPDAGAADQIHWTITGQTSVTFDWRGTADAIRFGPTTAYDRTVAAIAPVPYPFSSPGPFWEARLTGLSENTLYHYSIGDGPDHTFRTPPARGSSDFVVYALGDIGSSLQHPSVPGVQSLVAAGNPRFVLALGDLTYGNRHGQAAVDQHFNDVMTWSQDAAYMPAWGNHEWDFPAGDDLRNYKGRFDLVNARASPGSPAVSCCGEDWYWFDYGNVRFIAYPERWPGAWTDWFTHASSLMIAAQSDPAIRYVVTYGHRPAYSSGNYSPGDAELRAYLDPLGLLHSKYVLNLTGHDHNYQRSHPQRGVVHLTVGTGGAGPYPFSSSPSWIAARAAHRGALRLRFTHTGIEGWMLCGPAGPGDGITCEVGSVIDSFMIASAVDVGSNGLPPSGVTLSAWVVPNPLPRGTLQFSTRESGPARAELFDLKGRRVRLLLDVPQVSAGRHSVDITGLDEEGNRLPAGVYFYRVGVAAASVTGRLLLVD